ncbi:hypothetical protein [Acetobacter senegalensis]|uniref:hypothetical protein n=1 Tax=Acetobacter senegalensis TaxID=446692 RepID=UPI0026530DE8|nr:hypothetical protein [Acetobacter senegalensis]MDN7351864.1 hypothetical protein [Acetobacter senegalensis]
MAEEGNLVCLVCLALNSKARPALPIGQPDRCPRKHVITEILLQAGISDCDVKTCGSFQLSAFPDGRTKMPCPRHVVPHAPLFNIGGLVLACGNNQFVIQRGDIVATDRRFGFQFMSRQKLIEEGSAACVLPGRFPLYPVSHEIRSRHFEYPRHQFEVGWLIT